MKKIISACTLFLLFFACACTPQEQPPINNNLPHEHSYTYTTQEPTCFKDGETVGLCECGVAVSNPIPKLEHEFKDGKCTRCNTIDPDYEEWSNRH